MGRVRRLVTTAVVGGGATVAGFYAFLIGEATFARRMIGVTDARPPSPDGVYGDDLPGRPVRCLVLGDSAAVGYGVTRADATPSALIGLGLAPLIDAPVEVECRAVVGAKTADLTEQIDLGLARPADVAVIVIGANDVTHQVPPHTSARLLAEAVRRLVDSGCSVVVGTCPDLGTVRPIPQPLRTVARWWSRRLARLQTVALVNAGGRAVSLGGLLGPVFAARSDVMFGSDRFHPSETGYANMVSVLVPAIVASLGEAELEHSYASTPRDLMSVGDAAAEAARHPGTQVVQDSPDSRWATVLRRRRH